MPAERVVIYCLIPAALERRLLEPLRRHYAHDPRVHVIVDRRRRDRRNRGKPQGPPLPPRGSEDRRNGSDRRRPVLQRTIDAFPARLERYRDKVRFAQRLVPVSSGLESLPADEVVERVRRGEAEAPTELYWRCFERVHSRLSVLLGDPASADAAVGAAFGRVLDAIDGADGPVGRFEELLYEAVDAGLADRGIDPAAQLRLPVGPSLAIADPLLDEPVVVTERDPRWFIRAQAERDMIIREGGDDVIAIEHVGGTAVPALAGRPVIDLLVGVESLPVPIGLHAVLLQRGYEHCGDGGTPGRAYYRRRGVARFDVHVVEHGGPLWHDPIRLREHLRRNNAEAYRWAAARRDAARGAGDSLLLYASRRAAALAELLARVEEQTSQRAG